MVSTGNTLGIAATGEVERETTRTSERGCEGEDKGAEMNERRKMSASRSEEEVSREERR